MLSQAASESDRLEQNGVLGIREHDLRNAISTLRTCVGQAVSWNARSKHRHFVMSAFPHLDQGRRIFEELFAAGGQPGARFVADEQWAVELILENPDSRADGCLGDVQIARRADEAARLDDFKESPGGVDVQFFSATLFV